MKMKQRVSGVINAIGGVFLWFAPWVSFTFMDQQMYQSGQHIGGIAYVLLAAWIAYGVFSWVRQPILALLSAGVAMAISLMFFVQVIDSVVWGLVLMIALSALALFNSAMDIRSMKREDAASATRSEPSQSTDSDPTID